MGADNDRRKATVSIVFGLFILWGFGWETVGRRLLMNVDGIIVASRAVPSGGTKYIVRRADGSEQVIWAGASDASLPTSMPVGTRIRKEPWHLDYERDGRRESFPWVFYSSVLGIALSLVVWGILILRSQPPNPETRRPVDLTIIAGGYPVSIRRVLSILLEGVGVTLFACGLVAALLFFSTESRVELARRGSTAKIPEECEAAFWNHGGYACWYTISDHPFWFAFSVGVLVGGGAIMTWSQSRWFPKRKTET
jgi:hypothetical protein